MIKINVFFQVGDKVFRDSVEFADACSASEEFKNTLMLYFESWANAVVDQGDGIKNFPSSNGKAYRDGIEYDLSDPRNSKWQPNPKMIG